MSRSARCVLCQSPVLKKPILKIGKFSLLYCPQCKTASTYPLLSETKLQNAYRNSYRSTNTGQRFPWVIDGCMKFWRTERAYRIMKLAQTGPVLDVGCGQAHELTLLQRQGLAGFGLESSKHYAESISRRTHIPIFSGNLQELSLAQGSCGVVSFLHSLEHFANPTDALGHAKKLLKNHGFLMIAVPDFESGEARLFRKSWFHLDLPRHRHHFSRTGLVSFLQTKGFQIISVRKFAPEYDYYSCVQSLLNLLFRAHPNQLYRILLKEEPKQKHDYYELLRELPGILMTLLISIPMTILMWLLRESGTVEIVAQKTTLE